MTAVWIEPGHAGDNHVSVGTPNYDDEVVVVEQPRKSSDKRDFIKKSYEMWIFRKLKEKDGKPASWKRVEKEQINRSSERIALELQKSKGNKNSFETFRKLEKRQQQQVNLFVKDRQEQETHPNAKWDFVQIHLEGGSNSAKVSPKDARGLYVTMCRSDVNEAAPSKAPVKPILNNPNVVDLDERMRQVAINATRGSKDNSSHPPQKRQSNPRKAANESVDSAAGPPKSHRPQQPSQPKPHVQQELRPQPVDQPLQGQPYRLFQQNPMRDPHRTQPQTHIHNNWPQQSFPQIPLVGSHNGAERVNAQSVPQHHTNSASGSTQQPLPSHQYVGGYAETSGTSYPSGTRSQPHSARVLVEQPLPPPPRPPPSGETAGIGQPYSFNGGTRNPLPPPQPPPPPSGGVAGIGQPYSFNGGTRNPLPPPQPPPPPSGRVAGIGQPYSFNGGTRNPLPPPQPPPPPPSGGVAGLRQDSAEHHEQQSPLAPPVDDTGIYARPRDKTGGEDTGPFARNILPERANIKQSQIKVERGPLGKGSLRDSQPRQPSPKEDHGNRSAKHPWEGLPYYPFAGYNPNERLDEQQRRVASRGKLRKQPSESSDTTDSEGSLETVGGYSTPPTSIYNSPNAGNFVDGRDSGHLEQTYEGKGSHRRSGYRVDDRHQRRRSPEEPTRTDRRNHTTRESAKPMPRPERRREPQVIQKDYPKSAPRSHQCCAGHEACGQLPPQFCHGHNAHEDVPQNASQYSGIPSESSQFLNGNNGYPSSQLSGTEHRYYNSSGARTYRSYPMHRHDYNGHWGDSHSQTQSADPAKLLEKVESLAKKIDEERAENEKRKLQDEMYQKGLTAGLSMPRGNPVQGPRSPYIYP